MDGPVDRIGFVCEKGLSGIAVSLGARSTECDRCERPCSTSTAFSDAVAPVTPNPDLPRSTEDSLDCVDESDSEAVRLREVRGLCVADDPGSGVGGNGPVLLFRLIRTRRSGLSLLKA